MKSPGMEITSKRQETKAGRRKEPEYFSWAVDADE